ncbi:putative transcription factor C2H2 family [Dioscorea sansibarensis]
MSSLLNLSPNHFSDLITSISTDLRIHHHRLLLLLLSPSLFSQTLSHLHSLSLSNKTLLLARFLLSSLHLLFPSSSTLHRRHHLRLPDLDAAILLFTMCQVYTPNHHHPTNWHATISNYVLNSTLTLSGLGLHGLISKYVDMAVKCRRLVDVAMSGGLIHCEKQVAASVRVVIGFPSVQCDKQGEECVVCKEEMELGRDLCRLPCDHVFHWMCILKWLRRRNTCPCCRMELETDDVFFEIDRIWRKAAGMCARRCATSGGAGGGGLRRQG